MNQARLTKRSDTKLVKQPPISLLWCGLMWLVLMVAFSPAHAGKPTFTVGSFVAI